MKQLLSVRKSPPPHWVGDGFPVSTVFSHADSGAQISPFLLLDYAPPTEIPPSTSPRGVGEHPHKGFETVTIVYQGELEHRDSTGEHGRLGPGDVQWMTAASGIVHAEYHAADFARRGGTLQMAQLWVNLPAKDKATPPGYQTLTADQIPTVGLADDAGTVRVIAGQFDGTRGPARTFTPVNVWDVRLNAGGRAVLPLPEGYTSLLLVLRGEVVINEAGRAGEGELAQLNRSGEGVALHATQDATVLALSGEPIDEPVAAYGPFVMNSREEIAAAIQDYQSGRMGHLG